MQMNRNFSKKEYEMKKIADVLFYIALVGLTVSGAYCFIDEYLILNRSTASDFALNIFLILGFVCLTYIGVYHFTNKSKS